MITPHSLFPDHLKAGEILKVEALELTGVVADGFYIFEREYELLDDYILKELWKEDSK